MKNKLKIYYSSNLPEVLILLKRILILMIIYSVSRVAFYLFNIEHFSDITFNKMMRLMAGGLKFDISALMFLNALYIVLYLLPFRFRYFTGWQRFLKYLFVISNGIAIVANTSDFFYFGFILRRSTIDVFKFAEEGNILILLLHFFIDYWYGVIFCSFLIIGLIFLYNKTGSPKRTEVFKTIYYPTGLIFFILIGFFVVIGMRGGFGLRPITLLNAGKYTERPLETSIVLNTPFTIFKTLSKKPLQEKKYFSDSELKKNYNPEYHVKDSSVFKNLNVVVIIMESFAREYVGSLNTHIDGGKYSGYTPFFDSLIHESKSYLRAFANGRKSIDALPSVISSVPSMVQPFVASPYASNEINSFGSLLKKKGYISAFFHGSLNGSMGFESYIKSAGYDRYYGMTEYGNDDDFDGSWGIWDEEFFQFFAKELDTYKEPFHATFFSVSSHHPFEIPERYKGKFRKGTVDFHIPVQYSDMALRKFFQTAQKMTWFKNTLFVITADHSNHAYFPEYKNTIGNFAIPIVFYYQNDKKMKGMDSTVVQQIDIMPTVLNYLNFDENYLSFGSDIFDSTSTNFAVNYIGGTYQLFYNDYLLQFKDDKTSAFYNYEKDRLLKKDIKNKNNPEQKEAEKIIKSFIQQYNHRMIKNKLTIDE